jgi:hypothetical protein
MRLALGRLAVVALSIVLSGYAGSQVTHSAGQPYRGPKVKSIALSPGGGVLGDAVAVELFNRGYTVVDPSETGRILGRNNLSEIELSSGTSLEALQGKGVDALLVVKTAVASDGLPQSASARLTSTRTQEVVAAIAGRTVGAAREDQSPTALCERMSPRQPKRLWMDS